VLLAALVLATARPLALWLVRPLVRSDPLRRADAIVVLGSGAYGETILTPESAYRFLYAVSFSRMAMPP
jgi:uncharacterized SAM-binding protein YcdF (DUF218 family)